MEVNGLNYISPTQMEEEMDLRRGPWTVEEDLQLINYIANHGEGRWNCLARSAGLKRTGKSCRLRWLNYLRPDVRRGNITLEEQLTILELHTRWGNRWSKIAQHLPGRTDNEIKNYWRTRVQKHAKQLRCDVNSKLFKDTMRYQWMPRLVERIRAAAASSGSNTSVHHLNNNPELKTSQVLPESSSSGNNDDFGDSHVNPSFALENSSPDASSVSPVTDLTDCYSLHADNNIFYNTQITHVNYPDSLTSPCGYFNHGLEFQGTEENNTWLGGEGSWDNLWNVDDMFFLE